MSLSTTYQNWHTQRPWAIEIAAAAICLALGAALMPVLIFYGGAATLGKYDGASLGKLFASLYNGLGQSSLPAWTVLLGPYALYILFKILRWWWRLGAR